MSDTIEQLIAQKESLTLKIRENKDDPLQKKLLIEECKQISQKIKDLQPPKDPIQHAKQQEKKKNLVTAECDHCKNEYQTSGKTRIPIVYCKECRSKRQDDILEYVTVNNFQIFTEKQLADAEKFLKKQKANVRLDLHKTLNTISVNTKLPTDSTCCVSYVGCLTATRVDAREEIMERIQKGQIQFGVLVFKRGNPKNENRNSFTEIGSKAWFNSLVRSDVDIPLFIDDSEDHVLSVGCIANVNSVQIKPGNSLLDLIKNNL